MTLVSPAINLGSPSQYLRLDGVSWDFYESLLDQIGDQTVRVTYDRGELEITSPLPKHERMKKIIAGMIELMAMELDIYMVRLGSTTFRLRDRVRELPGNP